VGLRAFIGRHKGKILLGWIALELAAIPAAAQMVERVSFSPAPQVIVADARDNAPGLRSFLVASNTPFVVEVEQVIGEVDVEVFSNGYIGEMMYGINAQMPGEAKTCTTAQLGITRVYQAERKTAAKRGNVQSHAVRVNVRFDEVADPAIRIVPIKDGYGLPGESCRGTRAS